MIVVHHLSNSHSHVILWLLEELEAEYKIVGHQRDSRTARSPESLRAVHPAAKAPTIEVDGQTMIESTGIILFLLEAYGGYKLRPAAGTPEAMRFYQWLTFIEGSAKAPLMMYFQALRFPAEDPRRQGADQHMRQKLALIESGLDGSETIVPGQVTAADFQLAFFEELMEALLPMEQWPNMNAHLQRMRQRDAYKRAESKGGPVGLKQLFASMGA